MPQRTAGIPDWVSEGSLRKYHRAVELLHKQGNANPTEAELKDLYVKWGGLVLESEAVDVPAEEPKKRKK